MEGEVVTRKQVKRFTFQALEDRCLLDAVGFVEREIHRPDVPGFFGTQAADMDLDGRTDLVTAYNSNSSTTIVWFRQKSNGFEPAKKLGIAPVWVNGMGVGEIDSDGDPDIALTGQQDDADGRWHVDYWFENPGAMSEPFLSRQIDRNNGGSAGCLTPCRPVLLEDLDNDGDADLVSGPRWYENTDGAGSFQPRQSLGSEVGTVTGAVDVTQDGAVDLVTREGNAVVLYINTGSESPRFERTVLWTSANDSPLYQVAIHNADGDEDFDLAVIEQDRTILLFENEGGEILSEPEAIDVGRHSLGAGLLFVDMDGDGDQDMMHPRAGLLLENEGQGDFRHPIAMDSLLPQGGGLADIDGDQDLDFYSQTGSYNVTWHENVGNLAIGPAHYVASGHPLQFLTTADFDHSGLHDLLMWGEGHFGPSGISVLNRPTRQGFTEPNIINREFYAIAPLAADLDGDGFDDIVTGRLSWFQNDAGQGFVKRDQIAVVDAESYAVADIDADGDDDLIVADGSTLDLFVNDDLHFRRSTIANESFVQMMFVDVDGDQDKDVVAAHADGRLVWFEKIGGRAEFVPNDLQVETDFLQTLYRDSIIFTAGDIDGDGDDDLILGGELIAYWYENADGLGTYVRRDELDLHVGYLGTGRASDIDGDGDLDLAAAGWDRVGWLENLDGRGQFSRMNYIFTDSNDTLSRAATSLIIDDADFDSDIDLIVGTYDGSILLFENRQLGDVNGDDEVNFKDFLVLSANFGRDVGAAWEDGDFDANGAIDFSDFLILAQNFGKRQ